MKKFYNLILKTIDAMNYEYIVNWTILITCIGVFIELFLLDGNLVVSLYLCGLTFLTTFILTFLLFLFIEFLTNDNEDTDEKK